MKKLKLLTSILLLIVLIGFTTTVRAESMVYDVSPTTGTPKEGEEISIKINISDINMGEDGINTFGAKLVYDENIFEKVTTENFSMKNNWTIVYNSEETDLKGTFLASNLMGTKENQEIGTLKLKVKTNLKSTSTEVKFTEVSSVGEDTYPLKDSVVTLAIEGTVKEEQPDKPGNEGNQGTNTPQPPQTTPTQPKTPSTTTTTQKDTTISNSRIPKAGEENIVVIASATVLVFAVLAIVSYVQFKKHKNF